MAKRIGAALLFGLSATYAAAQVSGLPQDDKGWFALGFVFVSAAWGKYSSSQTILAANRPVWSTAQRIDEAKK